MTFIHFRNKTNGPTTQSTTQPPMTSQTTANFSMETMTMEPITSEPMTGSTGSGSTGTGTTRSSVTTPSSIQTTETTAGPQPTPKPKHGFDGGSFGGGLALGIGLAAIIIIAYRCYIIRHKAKAYGDVQ